MTHAATILLSLLLACRPQVDVEPVAAPVEVSELSQRLQAELMVARGRYAEGERQAAADAIRAAYDGTFAELEPVLRAHDADATLALEYSFGRAAAHASARGERAVAADIDDLIAMLRAAIDGLPAPTGPDGLPLPTPQATGGITTVPAEGP